MKTLISMIAVQFSSVDLATEACHAINHYASQEGVACSQRSCTLRLEFSSAVGIVKTLLILGKQ